MAALTGPDPEQETAVAHVRAGTNDANWRTP